MLVHFRIERATEALDRSSFRESLFDASEAFAGHLKCLGLESCSKSQAEAGGARPEAEAGAARGDAPRSCTFFWHGPRPQAPKSPKRGGGSDVHLEGGGHRPLPRSFEAKVPVTMAR